jgi:hypothetical protein
MTSRFKRSEIEAVAKVSIAGLEKQLLRKYESYLNSLEPSTAEVKAFKRARTKAAAMRAKLVELYEKRNARLFARVCVRWDYCEKRKKVPVDLIVHVAMFLVEQNIGSSEFGPHASLELAAYSIKLDLLGVYCGCEHRGPKAA